MNHTSPSTRKQRVAISSLLVGVFVLGIVAGWALKRTPVVATAAQPSPQSCLRLGGYRFIQPLLACDTTPRDTSMNYPELQKSITSVIATGKANGSITTASIYLRNLDSRKELLINPIEEFFPASLKKVPLLIQYYKESETTPGFLSQTVTITDSTDYNANTTVRPSQVPEYGKTYTYAQLLEYMIKYSDNISFQVLVKQLSLEKFNQAYLDLHLHYPDNLVSIDDYMTPYQFSLFFRTLFNATYLNRENSEAVLTLLTSTEYKNGIVASIPSSVNIAHKFGVGFVPQPDNISRGELHDCGIIYNPGKPYLLCVMTKSESGDIAEVEKTLSGISNEVYKYAVKNF